MDMPPGTGDIQITITQRAGLAGAVVVSTPQDLALLDARRGVRMFEQLSVPILGVVENMSGFVCGAPWDETHCVCWFSACVCWSKSGSVDAQVAVGQRRQSSGKGERETQRMR